MPMDNPRASAIRNLMKFLQKSEADRFKPKEAEIEPAPESEAEKEGMDPEMMDALEALSQHKG